MPATPASRTYHAALLALAKLHGVQPSYLDATGARRRASDESLACVLDSLGAPAANAKQATASLKCHAAEESKRRLEPVTVVWESARPVAWLRLATAPRGTATCALTLEDGNASQWSVRLADCTTRSRKGANGSATTFARIDLPRPLARGYHSLTIDLAGQRSTTRVICAPVKSYRSPAADAQAWGLFCPVYALRDSNDHGAGDLTALGALSDWGATLGAKVVATLPLLAVNFTEPFDPSPYAPVSRIFWNELFADPTRAREYIRSPRAQRVASSEAFVAQTAALTAHGSQRLVDYRAVAAHRRSQLGALCQDARDDGAFLSSSFHAFERSLPLLYRYSAFRAACERQAKPWQQWPAPMRAGLLTERDFDAEAADYHTFAQYLIARQLDELSIDLRKRDGLLYLDLPVGVSPYGFDVWNSQSLYAIGCATGAPPDPYFDSGQSWGFPPMRPQAMREEGYATLIDALRAHMRRADYLRLDHVMAFHRLFWIPDSAAPSEGVYVRYAAEELYAILCLESHRNECRLVGENLGTVPPEVEAALVKHDLCGLYVAQYEMQPSATKALKPIPANCVASVNTHDMPPFATHWNGEDVDERVGLNLFAAGRRDAELFTRERMRRALVKFLTKKRLLPTAKSSASAAGELERVRDGVLAFLAQSPAELALVNIEDLWLETLWQNIPGTQHEHPNWRRRLRRTLDEIRNDPDIAAQLRRFDEMRRVGPAKKAKKSASKKRGRGRQAILKRG